MKTSHCGVAVAGRVIVSSEHTGACGGGGCEVVEYLSLSLLQATGGLFERGGDGGLEGRLTSMPISWCLFLVPEVA